MKVIADERAGIIEEVRPMKRRGRPRKAKEVKPDDSQQLPNWVKLRELLSMKDVVTFDELLPLMGEDSELFWEGKNGDGALAALDTAGFTLMPIREKKTNLLSEVYVNFTRQCRAEPKVCLSSAATLLRNHVQVERLLRDVGVLVEKTLVTVQMGKDGTLQIILSGDAETTHRTKILKQIADSLDVVVEGEQP